MSALATWSVIDSSHAELTGILDRKSVPALWQQIKNWKPESDRLQIDLKQAHNSDSAAMVLILHLIEHAKNYHCHIMLSSVPDKLLTLFEVSNALPLLDGHLKIDIEEKSG
jgi:phospholipid transport system transporter-binding protein